jgi:hypothetical protein
MIHKHEPIPEGQMFLANNKNTICQTIRDIYHKTDDQEIKLKCRIAVTMAKAMEGKLTEYKDGWHIGFWENK